MLYKIKQPPKWEKVGNDWQMRTPFVEYLIQSEDDHLFLYLGLSLRMKFFNIESAKKYAEEDFDARLKMCLDEVDDFKDLDDPTLGKPVLD